MKTLYCFHKIRQLRIQDPDKTCRMDVSQYLMRSLSCTHLGFLKSFLFCILVFKSRFPLCFFSKSFIIFSCKEETYQIFSTVCSLSYVFHVKCTLAAQNFDLSFTLSTPTEALREEVRVVYGFNLSLA